MLTLRRVATRLFQADQKGINDLKNEFYAEAREFVYFRKGEWHGVLESIRHATEWAHQNPVWVAIILASYQPAKDFIKAVAKATGAGIDQINAYFGRKKKHAVNRRVICGPSVRRADILKWEKICGTGSVVTIPKSQISEFRYIVNEKRYAIFSRFGPEDLRGIIGTDQETVAMLRDMFNREFIVTDLKKLRRKNRKRRNPNKAIDSDKK